MASLIFDQSKKGFRISFRVDGRKTSIWLGGMSKAKAETWQLHVEHLLEVSEQGDPPSKGTTNWMQSLSEKQHDKLARRGLVQARKTKNKQKITLGEWIDLYIGERTDVKGSTKETYQKAKDCLVAYFGTTKPVRDIRAEDAKRWRIWLATSGNRRDKNRKSMADATVRRRVGKAKQFFTEAKERGLVDMNPFAKLVSNSTVNTKRQFFVPADWIEQCIKQTADTDWRTILALARYGGLRCPSELIRLKWTDVNLPEGRMTIHASKTEHHSSGGVRVCPIFPELRPYLEAAWDDAPDNAVNVISRYRGSAVNLRTRFEALIKAAGLVPWPKLFQNLRASRETELMAIYPAKDVASWLGNSVPVAMAHYAMATAESFQKAIVNPTTESGSKSGSIGKDSPSIPSREEQEKSPEIPMEIEAEMAGCGSAMGAIMGEEGLEPPTSTL
jgi:integrase